QDAHEVLLQGGSAGRVPEGPGGRAVPDAPGGLTDPDAPGREHRVAGERAAGRVHLYVLTQAQLAPEHELLVAEGRVQLGDLDTDDAGYGCGELRRGGAGQVAGAHAHRVDRVPDAGDPGRVVPDLAGLVAGGEHDGGRTVGDRGAVVLAQRVGVH